MRIKVGNGGFVKGFLLIVLLVAVSYVLISFGKPYHRYLTLGSHTRDIMKAEIGNPDVIKQQIMEEARKLNVPLQDSNLEVTIDKKILRVNAHWFEIVDFWGYYQKRLDFNINEEY